MKLRQIIDIYPTLAAAKVSGMTTEGKRAYIKAVREFRALVTSFDEIKTDTIERLKHEDFDAELAAYNKARGGESMSDNDKRLLAQFVAYDKEVTEVINRELDSEFAPSFDRLTDADKDALVAANDWTAQQIMDIEDILQ